MNKRVKSSVNAKTKELEAELSANDKAVQSTYSVEAGRDVQTDLTSWQRQALGNQEQFAQKQGFRRRHPSRLLNEYAGVVKTNKNPKMKWEEYIDAENERIQLPETTKKGRNVYMANQMGLVRTAMENYVKSREKLSSIVPVGV
jgi:hypothetical protein